MARHLAARAHIHTLVALTDTDQEESRNKEDRNDDLHVEFFVRRQGAEGERKEATPELCARMEAGTASYACMGEL